MVPLLNVGEEVAGWLVLFALAFGPGSVAVVLWSPVLLSDRITSLFRALPPRRSLVASYLAVLVGGSIPYVVGVVAALVWTADTTGAVTANAILTVVVPLSFAYVVGFPLLAGLVCPRIGLDWDSTGYGPGTWAILVSGSVWYTALFAVPLFLVALVMALPT